ncbi:hypothetical protein ABPG75_003522 [Micractinium tetrahymenae]
MESVLGVNDLPDAALVSIFEALSLQERHCYAAPVCRRWLQLCNTTPQLLRRIDASFASTQLGAEQLTSFCTWLLEHAVGRVQQLSLVVEQSSTSPPPEESAAALPAAIAACGMGGSLRELRLHGLVGQPAVWASAMHGLRLLHLTARSYWEDWRPSARALQGL